GRDVGERTALTYIEKTESLLTRINQQGYDYRIASGGGRMGTTMDRYNADWNIVKCGWETHVLGKARCFGSACEAVSTFYSENPRITDQYLPAFVIVQTGRSIGTIQDGDSVVFFNFRGDRAIQISRAFEEKDFSEFNRERHPEVLYAGMMQYDGDLLVPKNFLVAPPAIDRTIGEYLCGNGISSFALSETQKFGHVTYFFNGNKSGYVDEKLEKYIEIPSDRIQFDKAPRMKADEITEKAIELLKSGKYKFGRINFPNGDMVGHTGIEAAIIEAVETVDSCVARLIEVVNELGGITIITADHGNADEMFVVKKGVKEVKTSHSLNPVPFVIIDSGYKNEYSIAHLENAGLANIPATILNLLGLEKPQEYEPSLITFNNESKISCYEINEDGTLTETRDYGSMDGKMIEHPLSKTGEMVFCKMGINRIVVADSWKGLNINSRGYCDCVGLVIKTNSGQGKIVVVQVFNIWLKKAWPYILRLAAEDFKFDGTEAVLLGLKEDVEWMKANMPAGIKVIKEKAKSTIKPDELWVDAQGGAIIRRVRGLSGIEIVVSREEFNFISGLSNNLNPSQGSPASCLNTLYNNKNFIENSISVKELIRQRGYSSTTIRVELANLIALGLVEADKGPSPSRYYLSSILSRAPPEVINEICHIEELNLYQIPPQQLHQVKDKVRKILDPANESLERQRELKGKDNPALEDGSAPLR
ncbi:MAG: alkaline phosphatase family protein, partial [Candidatus Omnitrophica bacterium]|nr:alkaline phosphatase family protein [Candidatus Omnitrophota bacterium]